MARYVDGDRIDSDPGGFENRTPAHLSTAGRPSEPGYPPSAPVGGLSAPSDAAFASAGHAATLRDGEVDDAEQHLELREEQLVAQKEWHELGEVCVRTRIEEVPGRLEVDALREEVEVEHVPVGQVVSERVPPWEENGELIVPVYEEQLVVVKRLLLREHLKIRRVATTERQLFEDTLRRERLVIDDPQHTGLVHEHYATADGDEKRPDPDARPREEGGFLEHLVRKAFQ